MAAWPKFWHAVVSIVDHTTNAALLEEHKKTVHIHQQMNLKKKQKKIKKIEYLARNCPKFEYWLEKYPTYVKNLQNFPQADLAGGRELKVAVHATEM